MGSPRTIITQKRVDVNGGEAGGKYGKRETENCRLPAHLECLVGTCHSHRSPSRCYNILDDYISQSSPYWQLTRINEWTTKLPACTLTPAEAPPPAKKIGARQRAAP